MINETRISFKKSVERIYTMLFIEAPNTSSGLVAQMLRLLKLNVSNLMESQEKNFYPLQ